jgi:hypothetical protein
VTGVVETQLLLVTAGARDKSEGLGAHPRPRPVGGDRCRVALQGVDLAAQPAGQHLFQFGQGTQRCLFDTGDGAAGGGAQADGDGDGFLVVQDQRRQGGARSQPVAAGRAPGSGYRVAEGAQPFHVVADCAGAHREAVGQLRAGPFAPRLEQ